MMTNYLRERRNTIIHAFTTYHRQTQTFSTPDKHEISQPQKHDKNTKYVNHGQTRTNFSHKHEIPQRKTNTAFLHDTHKHTTFLNHAVHYVLLTNSSFNNNNKLVNN